MGSPDGPDVEKPEQSEQERELARRGAQQWNRYVREYVPFTFDMVEESRVTDADRRDVAAESAAAAAQQTPRTSTIAERAAGGMEGGAAVAGLQDAASQQAAMTGVGEAEGLFEEDQQEHSGLMQAISTGHGVDALADEGYRSMTQGATQESIGDAQLDFADEMAEQKSRQTLGRMAVGAAIGGAAGPAAGGSAGMGALRGAQTAAGMSSGWSARGQHNPRLTDQHQAVNRATATTARNHFQQQMQNTYGRDPMWDAVRGAASGAGWR